MLRRGLPFDFENCGPSLEWRANSRYRIEIMQAHIHGASFGQFVTDVTLAEDEMSGSFEYPAKYADNYKVDGLALNICVWGGPTFNAKVTETVAPDQSGFATTVKFKRLQ